MLFNFFHLDKMKKNKDLRVYDPFQNLLISDAAVHISRGGGGMRVTSFSHKRRPCRNQSSHVTCVRVANVYSYIILDILMNRNNERKLLEQLNYK